MSNGQHYDWAKLIRQVGGKIDSRRLQHRRKIERGHAEPDPSSDPFECPGCGERLPVPAPCPRCFTAPLDLRTGVTLEEYVVAPAHGIGLVTRLRAILVESSRSRSAARARRARPPRPKPQRKPVRIRAVVNVVRPVLHPDTGQPCAAWSRTTLVDEPCDCKPQCRRRERIVRSERAVGLLILRLEPEIALVGVPRSVHRVAWRDPERSADVVLHDGAEVEVVGMLERRLVELPRTTGYRESPGERMQVCLVGTASAPCWILV